MSAAAAGPVAGRALSGRALAMLLLLACMFGANHVAARLAFDHGVDVATAVTARSGVTALVVALLLWMQGISWRPAFAQWRTLLGISLLLTVQSFCIYSAVARLPVALALLAFNTFPLWTSVWAAVLYRHRPERAVLLAMPVILVGLALALDVFGATAGLSVSAQWGRMGAGVGFAITAGAVFGLALVLTQHRVAHVDGRVRTALSMAVVGSLALIVAQLQGGFHWPDASIGWWALLALTVLYGTAFSIMFTLLPKLGVVGNSPILNIEPVASMVMAWLVLGQAIAPVQVLGALLVVAAVMALGLRR